MEKRKEPVIIEDEIVAAQALQSLIQEVQSETRILAEQVVSPAIM